MQERKKYNAVLTEQLNFLCLEDFSVNVKKLKNVKQNVKIAKQNVTIHSILEQYFIKNTETNRF